MPSAPQQAIYTRCHAPYSVTGQEGFGWRYVDTQINPALLDQLTSYIAYRQAVQSAGIHTPMAVYTRLYGYHVLLHSTPVADDLRGGNYLAHLVLARAGQMNACDAALNLWQQDFWIKKDVYEADWHPPDVQRLLRHQRGHATQDAQNILTQALAIVQAAPAGLAAVMHGLDYLLQHTCQRALLIRGTEQQIKACITLFLFSLPESLAARLYFVTHVRALNRELNPRPILLGWPVRTDATDEPANLSRPNSLPDAHLIDLLTAKPADAKNNHSLLSQAIQDGWRKGAIDPLQKRVDQLQDWCDGGNPLRQTDRHLHQGLALMDMLDDDTPDETCSPYHGLKATLLQHAIVPTPVELARIMLYLVRTNRLQALLQQPADTFLADCLELMRQAGHCMRWVRWRVWLSGRFRIDSDTLRNWLQQQPGNSRTLESALACCLRKMPVKQPTLKAAQINPNALSAWLTGWADGEPACATNRWLTVGIQWYSLQQEPVDRYDAFKQALRQHKIKLKDHEMAQLVLYRMRTEGKALWHNPPKRFVRDCRRLMIRQQGPSIWRCLMLWVTGLMCRERYLWNDGKFCVWLKQSNYNMGKFTKCMQYHLNTDLRVTLHFIGHFLY